MTTLLITVDVEFSAGNDPDGSGRRVPVTDRAVFCRIGERSHGLGFVLETFSQYGIKATFFVEAAHTLVLGHEAMRPAIAAIRDAGHDLQLHIHPMWMHGGRIRGNDSIAALDRETCRSLIETGIDAFAEWGLPKPLAFRAGNLQMRRQVYEALSACGIPISSSIGMAIHLPKERELQIESGHRRINGIVEVPLLTYSDLALGSRRHLKNLTVTGSGTRETLAVLSRARALRHEEVVLATHPHEFIKRSRGNYAEISPNRINQRRLQLLGEWTKALGMPAETFTQRAPLWLSTPDVGSSSLSVPWTAALGRVIENTLSDLIWDF